MELKNNYTVNNVGYKNGSGLPKCPLKKGKKYDYCYPNIFFGSHKECLSCLDLMKNYNAIVYDSILKSEQNPKDNIHLIRKDIEKDGGKIVKMDGRGEIGILIGATTTIEDYYYIWIDKDRKLQWQSCVGGYDVVNENEEDLTDLSVLLYMQQHDKKSLRKIIEDALEKCKYDKLITKIYI